MIAKKKAKKVDCVTKHPATVELACCQVLIRQLQARLRRFGDDHPEGCQCMLCRETHPELKMNVAALAMSLGAFSSMIEMDAPMCDSMMRPTVESLAMGAISASEVGKQLEDLCI